MNKSRHTQTGVVLLLTLLLIIVIGTSFFLAKFNAVDVRIARQAQTAKALAQAKEALLGYAVSYYDSKDKPIGLGRFGFLPCPDIDDNNLTIYSEGIEHGNCNGRNKSSIGRLPWKTLRIPAFKDFDGECLWYAVSGTYKNASTARAEMLNDDSNGFFKVVTTDGLGGTGNELADYAVAVIIAPHRPLAGQTREIDNNLICSSKNTSNSSDYLESLVDSGTFADIPYKQETFDTHEYSLSDNKNDQLAYITRKELFDAVARRKDFKATLECLTQIVAYCVANYPKSNANFTLGDKRLPFASPVNLSGQYHLDSAYKDGILLLTGRLPDDISISSGLIGNTSTSLILSCNLSDTDKDNLTACKNRTKILPEEFVVEQDPSYTIFKNLWKNWKDHIFYTVATAYNPAAIVNVVSTPNTTPTCGLVAGDCITVNGNRYIATITFANKQLEGQTRNASPLATVDTKKELNNYLVGTIENSSNTNDIQYCIREDLSVSALSCP